LELTMIWEVIQRRKWIILQALVIISLIAFVGSYFVTPSYRASAKIMIKSAKKGFLDKENIGLSSLASIIMTSPSIDINKILASSKPIIDTVVSKLQLRNQDGNLLKTEDLTRTGMAFGLKRKISPMPYISISQYQTADILEITANSPDPEEAMMMANTLAETMVNDNQMQMRAEYKSAQIFLANQIKEVKENYSTALRNLMEFKKKEKTLDLTMETKLATEKMAELLKQKEDNIIDLAEANAKLHQLKEQLAQQDFESPAASTLNENPQIEILKRRLTDLKLQLSQATTELTDKHPKVLSLREQIKMAEAESQTINPQLRISYPWKGRLLLWRHT